MRAVVAVLCLLTAVAFSACGHDGPTDPVKLVASLQSVDGEMHVAAGDVGIVRIRVVDASQQPLPRVPVSWEAPAGGTLDSTVTLSDSGGVARVGWRAPSTLGSFSVVAHVGAVQSPVVPMHVIPDSVTRFEFFPDTVRFTAQHQERLVRVVGHDEFGHVTRGFSLNSNQTVQSWVGDTAVVSVTSGIGSGTFYMVVTSWSGARDSVALVQQPIIASITAIVGFDTVNGLAVGQHAMLQLTGVDSLGFAVSGVNAATAVNVTSSDASVVSVAGDGSLTALSPGQATIDASSGSVTYHATVNVYPLFDVGVERTTIGLVYPDLYASTVGTYLTDDGTFYRADYYINRGSPGGIDVISATSGPSPWSRSFPLRSTSIVVDPSGPVYVADNSARQLHAIGVGGVDRWIFDFSTLSTDACGISGWDNGVIAGCQMRVFTVRADGSLAWSTTIAEPVRQFLNTPTLTFARTSGSIVAFAADGTVRWTIPTTASAAMADAAGNLYLTESGVRMVDANGVTRWQNPTPLAGCILATADRIIVCRNGSTITALANVDGHQLWSVTRATGDLAAIAGDAIVTVGTYLWMLDARSGTLLGRSLARVDASTLAVARGSLGAYSLSYAHFFTSPFGPGSDWSQRGGNAGRSGRVTP